MNIKTPSRIGALLLALLLVPAAQASVSIDEVLRLHEAGLSAQSLLLVVESAETPDTISTDQLTALLEAGVPDTVITILVYNADAVAEDWVPVDVDEEVEEYRVVTKTSYVDYDYYDPGWTFSVGVWWGNPHFHTYWYRPLYCDPWYDPWYDGWCGTSWYYSSWYWGPGIYVNLGWYPYYPYYYRPYYYYPTYYYPSYYYPSYYAWWYPDHRHRDHVTYDRRVDRPSYRGSVVRRTVDDGRSYRVATTDARRDTPLREIKDTERTLDKRVSRDDGRTLRDVDGTKLRTDRDTDGRTARTSLRPLDRTGDKTSTRDDRALRRVADESDEPAAGEKTLRRDGQTREEPRTLFDRYGDQARINAEKVERYKAMKRSQVKSGSREVQARPTTRTRTTLRRAQPAESRGSARTPARTRVTTRSERSGDAAKTRDKKEPAKVEAKKGETKAPAVTPQRRTGRSPSTRSVRPQSAPRDSGARSSSGGKSGSRRSGGDDGRSLRR